MPRRIRFIFGQTEESDPWDDMAAYVAHEEPVRFGFTPDADFPAIYCEKGILRLHLTMPLTDSGILDAKGGTVVNMVPDACTVTTAARLGEARTPLTAPWSSCRQRAGRSPRHIGRCFIHLQSYFCTVSQ